MGTSQTLPPADADDASATTALDVTEMPLSRLSGFVRGDTATRPLHLERRGDRTYLVADGSP